MLNQTTISISKNENPKILFDLPPNLDRKTFESIQRRNHYNFYYFFYKFTQELLIQKKMLNEEDLKTIVQKVTIEVTKRKKSILQKLGISMENEKDYENIWNFALNNFSQDQEFLKKRQKIQSIFQKIKNLILDGKLIKDLDQDPDKMSDKEIKLAINRMKEKTEKDLFD